MTAIDTGAERETKKQSRGVAAYVLPSLGDIIFIVLLFFVPVVRRVALINSDGDLARHLVLGRYILQTGSLPSVDVFSHTMDGQWYVAKEWLAEVAFALAHQAFGMYGVALLSSTLIAATFWVLYRLLVWKGVHALLAAGLTLLAAAASSIHWLARPHLFTMLLSVMTLWLLERYWERGGRLIFALPFLMILWANLHAGFPAGFVLLAIFLSLAILQTLLGGGPGWVRVTGLAIVTVASVPSIVIHPAGLGVILWIIRHVGHKFMYDNTREFMSPDFHNPVVMVFLILVLLMVASLAVHRGRREPRCIAIIAVWLVFSLTSVRNVPLFAVLVTPIVGIYLQGVIDQQNEVKLNWRPLHSIWAAVQRLSAGISGVDARCSRSLAPLLALALAILVAANSGYMGRTQLWGVRFEPAQFPVTAVDFVRQEHIPGLMFNDFKWGGYLVYALYPDYKIFIDGQTDLYGDELMAEYLTVAKAQPGWREILDRHEVNWAIVPTDGTVDVLLREVKDWRLVYRDKTAVIYVRNISENDGIHPQVAGPSAAARAERTPVDVPSIPKEKA